MPRCLVGNHDSDDTVYAIIGGRRVDMCRYHWACWQRVGEGVTAGLSRWLAWNTPTWRHGDAQYQIAWEGGQVVGRRLSDNAVISQSSSATTVLNALMSQTPGLIRVEPIGSNPPYPLTATVWLVSGFSLRGYGRQSAFRLADSASFDWGAFYLANQSQIAFSDFRVDGNRAADRNKSWVIHGRPASRITIDNVEVHDQGFTPSTGPPALPCAAIYSTVAAIQDWKITNSTFWNCDFDAIFLAQSTSGVVIRECVFGYNAQRYGYNHVNLESGDVRTWAAAPEIYRCVSRYCGRDAPAGRYNIAGFHLRNANGALIEDCLSEHGASQGILLFNCRGAIVRRALIHSVQRYVGLYLEGCPDSMCEKIVVQGIPNGVGITIGSYEEYLNGELISYKSHGSVAKDCRVSNCGGPGIVTDSSRVTILDCDVTDCGILPGIADHDKAAYQVCGTGQKGSKVIRCRASGSKYGWSDTLGSGSGTSEEAVVADCDFSGCQQGFYFGNPNHQHVVVRNRIPS